MGQAGDMKVIAIARVCHFWNQVAIGSIGEVVFHRFVCKFARHHLDLVRRRDHYLLTHVANDFVHHEHHGNPVFFGQVEGLDGQIETLLRRIGTKGDDLVIAMRAPFCLHHVGLGGERGQAG